MYTLCSIDYVIDPIRPMLDRGVAGLLQFMADDDDVPVTALHMEIVECLSFFGDG